MENLLLIIKKAPLVTWKAFLVLWALFLGFIGLVIKFFKFMSQFSDGTTPAYLNRPLKPSNHDAFSKPVVDPVEKYQNGVDGPEFY